MNARRTTRVQPPCVHLRAEVTAAKRLTPQMARISFGGPELAGFQSAGYDQRIKLFLPRDGQDEPRYPTDATWWLTWREWPEHERAVFRSYTIRRHRPEAGEIDIDFVLHGDTGPASRWAYRAAPGDRVGIWGPAADYDPEPRRQLIVGDETALPAIGAIVESLGPDTSAEVYVAVADRAAEQDLSITDDTRLSWLHRGDRPAIEPVLDAVRGAQLPGPGTYAWVAGEASMVRAVRRCLIGERGMDRESIYFSGYWRHGKAEDEED